MNDDCSGWLSKAHPPKSMIKPLVKQKGPLSRSIPSRRIGSNKALESRYASYMTQNSPPPPQLVTARKQSSLTDFFGFKEDKHKPAVKETSLKRREMAPLVTSSSHEHSCEGSYQIPAVDKSGNYVYEQASLNHLNDLSFFSMNSAKLEEEHLTCGSGSWELKNVVNNPDISVPIRSDCSCNKENSWQECKQQRSCSSLQDIRTLSCSHCESQPYQEQKRLLLMNEKSRGCAVNDPDEFVTFSEGLKFLSQESQVNVDSETFSMNQCDNVLVARVGHRERGESNDLDSKGFSFITKNNKYEKLSFKNLLPETEKDCDSPSLRSNISYVKSGSNLAALQAVEDTNKNIENSYSDHNSCDPTCSQTSDDALTGPACQRFFQPQHYTSQDMTTPNFTDESLATSDVDYSNTDSSVFKGNQFQRKKEMYMLDMGSFVLSEIA